MKTIKTIEKLSNIKKLDRGLKFKVKGGTDLPRDRNNVQNPFKIKVKSIH
ncbi:hypothetical protein [uncultured Aquimarina sp.]|nr:hypothetical protein [uncultured Aquimarina sp.]